MEPPERDSIPLLDMSASEETLLPTLVEACEKYGFFYVVNHGLEGAIDDVFQAAAQFFELSVEEKMKLAVNGSGHGYVWRGEERLDPERQTEPDTKENFQYGEERAGPEFTPLRGPNVWPHESLLPGWRARMTGYYAAAVPLAMRICGLLAASLGLRRGHFDAAFADPLSLVALNHYSERRSAPDDGVLGCGEHSDYDVVTLLATDQEPGLEVRLADGTFLAVAPRRHAFICNVGDAVQHMTNGRYRSAPHRVVSRGGRERTSVGLFFRPGYDFLVDCLPCCCGDGNPKRYEPITFGQHLMHKYQNSHTHFQTASN